MQAYWHTHNPWADRIIYITLDDWLNCLAEQDFHNRLRYRERAQRHGQVDCYILPGPTQCSLGMRFGLDSDYYSPLAHEETCRKMVEKYRAAALERLSHIPKR